MKKVILLIAMVAMILGCENTSTTEIVVSSADELNLAVESASPGDVIVMANGIWNDMQLNFRGEGTADNPIVIKAEIPGEVFVEGESFIKFAGEHLVVDGLYFRNGYTPSNAIIDFRINDKEIANNCRVTNVVIDKFTQPDRFKADHWIEFWGRNNQLDHCYIAGKSNQGPTIRVQLKGNESIYTYHKINDNHFGPRPRKGGPKAETMQIGDSGTSMTPAYVLVYNNLFDRCNGEVEVISSKANFNEFRNNVFFECEGSLVMRHGNYATIDGNLFIGNDNSEFIGGIRVINTGHWITNNYFYKLKGNEFRAPLAVMNGIPKSPLNRYNQVTDVVVAHNTWIDCNSPWHFSVGANLNQREVLPPSEIRSARPVRTILANNLIFNGDEMNKPIVNYDEVDGVLFKNNVFNQENKSDIAPKGLKTVAFEQESLTDWLAVPTEGLGETYQGFDFETITTDVFGKLRSEASNSIGAVISPAMNFETLLSHESYGPSWFSADADKDESTVHSVSSVDNLQEVIANATSGDVIAFEPGTYEISQPLHIDKKLTFKAMEETRVELDFTTAEGPVFTLHPEADILLENLKLSGNGEQVLMATLKENMSSAINVQIEDSEIQNFNAVLKVFKGAFADSVTVRNSKITNCENGIELAEEIDDKGDYNAEFVTVDNSEFTNVRSNVINYYRGGYDESTIGGNLSVSNSTFTRCGTDEATGILLKTRGIVNVSLDGNRFENNPVSRIAVLWGEKGQVPGENTIKASGKIEVVQNLKLKLMY